MTDTERVLIMWVEITTPAGKLESPGYALPIDEGLPEGFREALASMGEVNGVAEAAGVRMCVHAYFDERKRGEWHRCPLRTDEIYSSDPWSWDVTARESY